jgi:hypothetical protein
MQIVVLVMLGVGLVGLGTAQAAPGPSLPGPETYTLIADFGMQSPVTTRLLSMGAPIACMNDVMFANPAFAGAQKTASAGLRWTQTDFDNGPTVSSSLVHVTYPTHANETGFEATLIDVDTRDEGLALPGQYPMGLDMSEDAWVVDYGRRIKPKWLVGLSVLGRERLDFGMSMGGQKLVDYLGKAEYGAQVGAAYEWAPEDYIGLIYSFTKHDVTANIAQMPGPFDISFHASQWAVGASRHVRPDLILLAEWDRGELKDDSVDNVSTAWHFGAEYMMTREWALRAGLADGKLTAGLGYDSARWRFEYAYLRDWNGSDVGQLLGSSNTNSVQAIYRW